jgi:hydrogenase/urease accessory protein HupE
MALRVSAWLVTAGVVLASAGRAEAHAVSTAVGDFYGGALHLVSAPDHLLTILGLGLLLGRGRREVAAEPLVFVLPLALATGGLVAWSPAPPAAFGVASLLLVGGLLAAGLAPPRQVMAVLVLAVGLGHGFANRAGMTGVDTRSFVAGVALAGFLLALYAMALARQARSFRAGIAVRVVGSWIAATGILVFGMRP